MITDEDKERVRQATDILQLVGETVDLRQRGNDWWGCCPFHHEKSPSFHVIPSTGLWKCFGCGLGGDVFAYVMKRESLDFPDSIRYLADRAGIELSEERGAGRKGPKRNRLVECLDEAQSFYATMLMRGRGEGPAAARRYLAGRGFGSDVCRRWGLGFAPGHGALVAHLRSKGFKDQEILAADLALPGQRGGLRDRFFDRAMFPIRDEQGRTIGFGGRVLTDAKPKYLNTKDTSVFSKGKHLFAFDRAKESLVATGDAVVCEGYTDVISMHEAGFTNVVAALGTALTLDHVRMIGRFAKRRIVCMFDGDAAGQHAAERAIQFLDKTPLEMTCVVLPGGEDPAEFLADHGAEAMRQQLAGARPLMDFVFEKRLEGFDLSVPGQRVAALSDLSALLAPLSGSILLDRYATQVADLVGADVSQVKGEVRRAAERRGREERRAQDGQRAAQGRGAARRAWDVQSAAPLAPPTAPEATLRALSGDERMQGTAERELLALIAREPDAMRARGERVASISWSDPRHEAMAWAMLATPAGTSPQEVVRAAGEVVPEAPQILASARLPYVTDMGVGEQADFLLDTVELWGCRREVRRIRGQLRSGSGSLAGTEAQDQFRRATELQKRISELSRRLAGVE